MDLMQPDGDTTTNGANASPRRASVLRSAAFMSLGTLGSRVLGLARDLALAALFPRVITDAYVVAFRLPNLFRRLLGEGSLAASFVPLYMKTRLESEAVGQKLAHSIFTLLVLTTATLSALGVVFMDQIMELLVGGEGYQAVSGKMELTVHMGRVMFGFLFFVMSYAFLMSLLNAHGKFFLPALAPAGLNLCIILSCFLPSVRLEGDQLAWGVLVGGALQFVLVVFPLVKLGHMPRLSREFVTSKVVVFFRKLIPSMLGMSVLQILALINVRLGSELPQGTHSYIYLADRLLEFPVSLMSVSLGVALLPTLSDLWARGEASKMVDTVHRHLRMLMFLSLPSAAGLFILAEPLVNAVFGRGEFGPSDVAVTASVLKIYAFVLIFSGIHRVLVPAFYAIQNTWLPAVLSGLSVLVHFFVATWATEAHGLMGLVWATAFTGFLNLAMLVACFKLYFKELGVWTLLLSVLKLMPALVLMSLFCAYASPGLLAALGKYFGLGLVLVGAVGLYLGLNHFLRHPDSVLRSKS